MNRHIVLLLIAICNFSTQLSAKILILVNKGEHRVGALFSFEDGRTIALSAAPKQWTQKRWEFGKVTKILIEETRTELDKFGKPIELIQKHEIKPTKNESDYHSQLLVYKGPGPEITTYDPGLVFGPMRRRETKGLTFVQ